MSEGQAVLPFPTPMSGVHHAHDRCEYVDEPYIA